MKEIEYERKKKRDERMSERREGADDEFQPELINLSWVSKRKREREWLNERHVIT